MSLIQLPLFAPSDCAGAGRPARGRLDPVSEDALRTFSEARRAAGAHPQSVARDISQLRAIVRASVDLEGPTTLGALARDVPALARVLREPPVPIARTTGRARLGAAQRFLRTMAVIGGYEPAIDLAQLDALLPARPPSTGSWHAAGTIVAGGLARRRPYAPALDVADLHRLVAAAGGSDGQQGMRDRALVALHCFSGLRPQEIVLLRWTDVATEEAASGDHLLVARVERGGSLWRLPILGPAAKAMVALATLSGAGSTACGSPIFRSGRQRGLGYRAARDVLRRACRDAGLPPAEAADLRAACAQWLGSCGLSTHEIASVLGLARVRTIDRLLQRHAALDAQRTVREMIAW